MADLAIAAGYEKQAGSGTSKCQCLLLSLYLYLYAVQSWDVTKGALNYFDQPALIKVLSKIEQMFYICNYKPAC